MDYFCVFYTIFSAFYIVFVRLIYIYYDSCNAYFLSYIGFYRASYSSSNHSNVSFESTSYLWNRGFSSIAFFLLNSLCYLDYVPYYRGFLINSLIGNTFYSDFNNKNFIRTILNIRIYDRRKFYRLRKSICPFR